MKIINCTVLFLLTFLSNAFSRHPLKNYTESQPVVNYILRIDTTDLSSIYVEMNIRNVPDTFEVAMAAHPEYDDRYWRFVKDMHVEGRSGEGKIFREDSALWRIIISGGEAVLYYRVELPGKTKYPSAWRPFISSTGALLG